MPQLNLHRRLRRAHAEVRRALVLRHALRAAAALCALVAIAVLAGMPLDFGVGVAWTRAILVALAALAALALTLARWRAEAPRFDPWLEAVERSFPDVRSWLRNALDLERTPPAHTSPELAEALHAETARRLERVPLRTLVPAVRGRAPLLAIAAAAGALTLVALVAPARVQRSWATLWDPDGAAPPVRLAVEPGSVRVSPGAALAVRARVWGSAATPRIERDGGPAVGAVSEGTGADGARVWRFDLAMITRDESYRVHAARAVSPRYRIALAGEPAPVSFEVEYRAPAYARLPVQRGTSTRGDLEALRGTVATVTATFDRDLSALEVTTPTGARAAWSAVTPRRWRGTVPILRAGSWTLAARAPRGATTLRYPVTPVEDAPPVISVVVPGGDEDLPAGQQVPVEVVGEDDLGLSELTLQYRTQPDAAWRTLSLQRFGEHPREARVRTSWDASTLGLLPGQSATFRFALWDDDAVSGRKAALSPTFALRFPTLADLYQSLDRRQDGVQSTLEHVADQARDLQKTLDRLSRPTPQARATPQSSPSYERREEMKSALQRQQELAQKVTDATQDLRKSLEDAAERQAFDQELMRKLHEVNDLMQQIQSPEFKDALQRIQQAMATLDKRASEQDVKQWRDASKEMLQNLERTLALLKELRNEERLASLAKRADELAKQQDALNQQHDAAPPKDAAAREQRSQDLAAQQKAAADRARELGKETTDTAKQMEQAEQDTLQQVADQLQNEAAPEQDQAAQEQSAQQGSQARQSGERASRSLQSASRQLSRMSQSAQQRRNGADVAAVRRAAQDLVSLQRSAQSNLDDPAPQSERADRQTDLSDGVARVADSLYTLAQRSPFISPQLGQALGRAMQSLSESGRQMGRGDRAGGEQSGREGSQALNESVRELRSAEASMCQQPGTGKPGGQGSSAQQIGEMSERQNELNQRSRTLAQRLSQQMRLSAGDQEEMRRLADQQRRLREELEGIQSNEQRDQHLLGRLDAAHQDMEKAEEQLRSGEAGDDLTQVQDRILSRLLDAQRSVNRRDYDPERESRPGEDVARSSPAPLPSDLLSQSDRLRLGLLKAEADRYPAQYRAFVEAYLKALNEAQR